MKNKIDLKKLQELITEIREKEDSILREVFKLGCGNSYGAGFSGGIISCCDRILYFLKYGKDMEE